MKKTTLLIVAVVLLVSLVGCGSMSTGSIEGGRTDLDRKVETSQGRATRTIRINPQPTPQETKR